MKALAAKMIKILGAVSGKVTKSGYNSHNKYHYVMEADLLDAVRSELVAHKVFVFSSIEEVNQEGTLTTIRTKHTFVDSESGETFEVFGAGQGKDAQDKGLYKAITGASKYFLLKSFMMAGDDDPEKDSAVSKASPKKITKPATKPATKKSPSTAFSKPTAPTKGFGSAAKEAAKSPVLDDIEF